MRWWLLALLAALTTVMFGSPGYAANIVVNGGFEQLTMSSGNAVHSTIISNGNSSFPYANGWSSTGGYNFVMTPNPTYNSSNPVTQTGADDRLDGAYIGGGVGGAGGGRMVLWGPDAQSANGLTGSPTGGNFLAADGSFLNRPVEQTLSGLVAGTTYYLSFYWAAGQQYNFGGGTKEGWVICLGTCEYHFPPVLQEGLSFFDADPGNTDPADLHPNNLGFYDPTDTSQIFKTAVVSTPEKGFTPWKFESFSFVAQSDTQKLSLLAYGTPFGQPPFALIDGITIDTPVPGSVLPEPTSWAMMLIGFGVIGGLMRTRRRPINGHGALGSQIV